MLHVLGKCASTQASGSIASGELEFSPPFPTVLYHRSARHDDWGATGFHQGRWLPSRMGRDSTRKGRKRVPLLLMLLLCGVLLQVQHGPYRGAPSANEVWEGPVL